ncbi:MAG: GNAT family N-acetyltransferase [Cyclobacteriaceae bacterium]
MELKRTTSQNIDFQSLVSLLDKDLSLRDGEDHSFYAQFNKIDKINEVIVAYENTLPIGCGAIKKYDEETAEVKRMFVMPEHRGKGIAAKILSALEEWAKELGYQYCILETGQKQPEAIALYKKSGYQLIPNYGQYAGVENSICMMKKLYA